MPNRGQATSRQLHRKSCERWKKPRKASWGWVSCGSLEASVEFLVARDRQTRRRRVAQPARVLIFGESPNDTGALRELTVALKPSLGGRVDIRKQPLVLIKDAKPEDVPDRASRIRAAVKAEQVK